MRSYLYAIVTPEAEPPSDTVGLRGAAVALKRLDGIGVWLSRLVPFQATREDLVAHHAVVEAACAAGPALPVRFGTSFSGFAALATALAPKAEALRAALETVGRLRELAITFAWRDPPSGTAQPAAVAPEAGAGPGRRFMAQRAARWASLESRRARATELERALHLILQEAGVERAAVKVRIVPAPRVALSCAVLIAPARAADVLHAVRAGADRWTDVTAHLAGPWPPYTFADGE